MKCPLVLLTALALACASTGDHRSEAERLCAAQDRQFARPADPAPSREAYGVGGLGPLDEAAQWALGGGPSPVQLLREPTIGLGTVA